MLSVHTTATGPESANNNPTRSTGYSTSTGTKAAPANHTPSNT
ncbi:hypothetical protein OK074_8529, partial [Actinobacteria bacterium OK074]